jgi:hypothetical protein
VADDDQLITSPAQVESVAAPPADPSLITQPSQVDETLQPGYVDFASDSVPAAASTPGQPVQSVSAGYKGLTPAGEKRAAGTRNTIDAKVDAYSAADNERLAQQEGVLGNDIAAQKAANDQKATAQTTYHDKMGEAATKLAAANEEYARQEQENGILAKQEGAKFLQNYTQQLAAVRAMTVNPAGPLAELSPGAMGGLTAAMFAQGFLAARGIKIDVQGQVDSYIQRSIHEQERRINQAQQGAQDQLSLWQIAKQNSHDEWEARQRYRGFMLESMKASNEVLTSRFQSQLANADAASLNAQLDTQSHQTAFALRDRHEQRVLEMRKYYSDEAYKAAMIHIEELKAQAAAAANAAKKGPEAPDIKTYKDPITGKVIGYNVNKTLGAEEADKKVRAAEEAVRQVDPLWKQYEAALKKAGATGPLGKDFWARTDADANEAKALGSKLVQMAVYADSGKAVTEEEFKRHADLIPVDNFWQAGNSERIRQNYLHHAWDKYRSVVQANSEDPVSGRNAAGTNPRGINPDEDANFQVLQRNPDDPANAPAPTFLGKEVAGAKAKAIANKGKGPVEGDEFFNQSDERPYKPVPASDAYRYYTGRSGDEKSTMPAELGHVEDLAEAAVNPAGFRAQVKALKMDDSILPNSDDTLKAEGLKGLKRLAADKNKELSGYAKFLIDRIEGGRLQADLGD